MSTHSRRKKARPQALRRSGPPGTAPGTLTVDPSAPKPTLHVIAYGPDDMVEEDIESVDRLSAFVGRWPVTWVNVDGLGDADVLERLGTLFGLHHLALEDVVNVVQRAKVEAYDENLFIVGRMPLLGDRLTSEQITLFLGKGWVVTFQERAGDCFETVRQRIRSGRKRIRSSGPDYLAYALFDALVDSYFPVVEKIGIDLEQLEAEVHENPSRETVARIQDFKRILLSLRRTIWPHREASRVLVNDASGLIREETSVHLRDCFDHAVQIIELVESYRETTTDLMNLYLSNISNRMNEIMKVLTIIATIFIPLGFIAGIYGMNFDPGASRWNMPELGWQWGYPFALGLMLVVAGGMLLYFTRKGWFR